MVNFQQGSTNLSSAFVKDTAPCQGAWLWEVECGLDSSPSLPFHQMLLCRICLHINKCPFWYQSNCFSSFPIVDWINGSFFNLLCPHSLWYDSTVLPTKQVDDISLIPELSLALWWALANGMLANVRWPQSRSWHYMIRLAFLPLCQHLEKHMPRLACWSQKED